MKSIIIVNPVRYTGYGYIKYIKNNLKDYRLIGLWPYEKAAGTTIAINDLDAQLTYREDFDSLIKELKQYNPQCFLVGDDYGFPLADRLQCHFFPDNSNDFYKHKYRIDKFEYLNYLYNAGSIDSRQFVLNESTIDQCLIGDWVVKPSNGAGNINVHIKPNFDTLKSLLNSDTKYMVQNFVDGDEYCMEISSYKGMHKCTMASQYKGEYLVDNIFPWREENELISPNNPIIPLLYDYVTTILDMLGVKLGLTWTQVKINNNQCHLIEINFRSQGHAVVGPIFKSTGNHWAQDSVKSYLNHDYHTNQSIMYDKFGDFNKICVNNKRERYIEQLDWHTVSDLNSVVHINQRKTYIPGTMPLSKNFPSVMGMVIIQNNNFEQYCKDLIKINEWKQKVSQ